MSKCLLGRGKDALIHKDSTKFHIHVHDGLYYLHTVSNNDDDDDDGDCDDQCEGCHDIETWHEILGTVITMTFRSYKMLLMV